MMRLGDDALDRLFRQARTHRSWRDEPVADAMLRELYELLRFAPTSANSSPGRFVFLRSREAKERLRPALVSGNVDKTMSAPVTAIVAYDLHFHEHVSRLFPDGAGMRALYDRDPGFAEETARRNSSLQGGYMILAARALGLDCGPMSGVDTAKVDAEFFPDGRLRTNFLCNLGHGDASKLRPRGPRLEFDEACLLL